MTLAPHLHERRFNLLTVSGDPVTLSPSGCEVYAFCGALFGICSMMTLMVIAVDRYVVITRPLASLGAMSRRKALSILAVTWLYSMGWSLPPFFGWSECGASSAERGLSPRSRARVLVLLFVRQ